MPRTPAERAALEQVVEIDNDPAPPANDPSHPGHQATLAAKVALWRRSRGARNRPVASYREDDDPPIVNRR